MERGLGILEGLVTTAVVKLRMTTSVVKQKMSTVPVRPGDGRGEVPSLSLSRERHSKGQRKRAPPGSGDTPRAAGARGTIGTHGMGATARIKRSAPQSSPGRRR